MQSMPDQQITMLDVPYSDRDQAKAAGARPYYENNRFVGWYAPAGSNLECFERWLPVAVDQTAQEAGAGSEGPQSLTLSQVLRAVKRTFQMHHSAPVWVRAEILHVSGSSHMYLELGDYDAGGSEQAKAKATIWASKMGMVRRFSDETGVNLQAGVKVLLQVVVEFSERFGLSLAVQAIDPSFTLGDMEAKLRRIRENLRKEGVLELNRNLPRPREFCHVAVIAPAQAAGLGDFTTQSDKLQHAGLCQFYFFEAQFQGPQSVPTIASALQAIDQDLANGAPYDAVAIIRGGGDKAGLYALNEEVLARLVCTCQIPVLVGIGHERDNTILDEVACVRCPTPSLVVSHIGSTIIQNAREAQENILMLKRFTGESLSRARLLAEQMRTGLREAAAHKLSVATEQCNKGRQTLLESAKQSLIAARHQARTLMQDVLYSDPQKVVGKGYAIVRGPDGKVTGDAAKIPSSSDITIELRDGAIQAKTY